MRILSFLSDIEHALVAEASMAGLGSFEIFRMVNYHQGLGRMSLSERTAEGALEPKGDILLQSFSLADGSLCLKANLHWAGSEARTVMSVYSKPRMNWKAEAGMVASAWLSGPPAVALTSESTAPLAKSA